MALQEQLCFVQFMHPGKEHRGYVDGIKAWNEDAHKRKFLENQGRCQRDGKEHEGLLRFWAEWEPQSEVIQKIEEPVAHGPRFVCRPFYIIPESYNRLQNTDPFAFGGFYYTLCQQYAGKHPTQLRFLKRGSVILFGSCVGGKFALDTVFVVDRWEDHDASDYKRLRSRVPKGYWETTLAAWYHDGNGGCGNSCSTSHTDDRHYRLYWGATVDSPVEGMFSFFPCQPAELSVRGFARPVIKLPGIITDNLMMGKRLNKGLSIAQVRKHWSEVRRQVKSAGLWIGINSEMPGRRTVSA